MSATTEPQLSNQTLLERTQEKLWNDGLGAARAHGFDAYMLGFLCDQVDPDLWRRAVKAADLNARRPLTGPKPARRA